MVSKERRMYDLVVCSMFKNESMILQEWIEHYLQMGVQHFYLIDNGSTDSYLDILQPYIDRKLVTLTVDPFRFSQTDEWTNLEGAYYDLNTNEVRFEKERHKNTQSYLLNKHFLKQIKENAQWVIVIDQDEYFFSKQTTLKEAVLNLGDTVDVIWAPWRIFGTSGHKQQPESIRRGFVHKRPFDMEKKRVFDSGKSFRGNSKSMNRVEKITDLGIHICQYRTGDVLHLMFPNGKIIKMVGNEFSKQLSIHFSPMQEDPSTDSFFLNHYAFMSLEYFKNYKSQRDGGADNRRSTTKYFEKFNANTNEVDTEILKHPLLSIEPLSSKEMEDAESRKMHTIKDYERM